MSACRAIAVLMLVGSALGCGGTKGIKHKVRPGETLYRIGKAYGIPYQELAELNEIDNPSLIHVDQTIFIPGAERQLPVDLITPASAAVRPRPPRKSSRQAPPFSWPIKEGRITSRFGERDGSFHDGIDISAARGTPVRAAMDGDVIYSDTLRGYGNVIILRHVNGFATVYAHNDENEVAEGSTVGKGERIARVGDSGRTTGCNLHFEIRRDNVAEDPLAYLPGSVSVAGAASAYPAGR